MKNKSKKIIIILVLIVICILISYYIINGNYIKEKKELLSFQAKEEKMVATTIEETKNWTDKNISIELQTNGTMRISCIGGSGAENGEKMSDYGKGQPRPWDDYKTLINEVEIEDNNKIISIGNYTFEGCTALTKVKLGTYMVNIGEHAFEGCTSLASIEFVGGIDKFQNSLIGSPQDSNKIGECAFKGCTNLKSVKLPIKIELGNEAFYECTLLNNLTFGDGSSINSNGDQSIIIGSSAFRKCSSLVTVNLTNKIKEIGENAFDGCKKLQNVNFTYNNNNVSNLKIGAHAFAGCTNIQELTLSANFGNFDEQAFEGCVNLQKIDVIPTDKSTYSKDGVLYIKQDANNVLVCYPPKKAEKTFTIPNDVKWIKPYAFRGCQLLTRVIIEGDSSIESNAFLSCQNLTDVIINGESASIKENSFNNTPNSSKSLMIYCKSGSTAIQNAQTYGYECTEIKEYMDNISKADNDNVFAVLCEDDKLIISGTGEMKDFGTEDSPWYESYKDVITSVVINTGLTNIGNNAFKDLSRLNNVTIPNSVVSIGDSSLLGCEVLTNITIPNSVTSIGTNTFGSCPMLSDITVDGNNQNYSDINGVLFDKNKKTLIKYPEGKTDDEYVIPDSVTTIDTLAFANCDELTSVTIPRSVTNIKNSAFKECSSLVKAIFICENPTLNSDILSTTSPDLKIYCWKNSSVYNYANNYSMNFEYLDNLKPIIEVTGNPEDWQDESVTLTINAEPDEELGFALVSDNPYSFDGGEEWQSNNEKVKQKLLIKINKLKYK